MAESKAGVPQQLLPRSILISTPVSAGTQPLRGHLMSLGTRCLWAPHLHGNSLSCRNPCLCRHPVPAGTPLPPLVPHCLMASVGCHPPAITTSIILKPGSCRCWSSSQAPIPAFFHPLITSTSSTGVTWCPRWGQCHEGRREAACWQHPGTIHAGRARPGSEQRAASPSRGDSGTAGCHTRPRTCWVAPRPRHMYRTTRRRR